MIRVATIGHMTELQEYLKTIFTPGLEKLKNGLGDEALKEIERAALATAGFIEIAKAYEIALEHPLVRKLFEPTDNVGFH